MMRIIVVVTLALVLGGCGAVALANCYDGTWQFAGCKIDDPTPRMPH